LLVSGLKIVRAEILRTYAIRLLQHSITVGQENLPGYLWFDFDLSYDNYHTKL